MHNNLQINIYIYRLVSSPQEDKSKSDSTSPSSHPDPAENGILPDDDDATSFSQLHATDTKNLSLCISPLALMQLEALDLGDIYGRRIERLLMTTNLLVYV
jgi:hypothetical protein